MCVANLTQSSYQCDVSNCNSCVQNNFCGQCADGYTVIVNTGGRCWKKYSPIPFCALTTGALCAECEQGYALTDDAECFPIPLFKCNVTGCQFCLEENVCEKCRLGFDPSPNITGTCVPYCTIDQCYTCFSDSKCLTCNNGYVRNEDSTACLVAEDVSVNCTIYEYCSECNAAKCTKCNDGYITNPINNECCLALEQNALGCEIYESVCSNECFACSPGYFKVGKQCVQLPCEIADCAYCFRSNNCSLCDEGFTLTDNRCIRYSVEATCKVDSCLQCDSNGQCLQCLYGYTLFNGYCVCGFQNCLDCVGLAFCTLCAYPMSATV